MLENNTIGSYNQNIISNTHFSVVNHSKTNTYFKKKKELANICCLFCPLCIERNGDF